VLQHLQRPFQLPRQPPHQGLLRRRLLHQNIQFQCLGPVLLQVLGARNLCQKTFLSLKLMVASWGPCALMKEAAQSQHTARIRNMQMGLAGSSVQSTQEAKRVRDDQ
jgi:hypothetical protein